MNYESLNNEELRVKVAEKLGYKRVQQFDYEDSFRLNRMWEKDGLLYEELVGLPNWPTDLNACAEMEKAIPEGNSLNGRVAYTNALMRICGSHSECVFATARQRCLAFLKVMG